MVCGAAGPHAAAHSAVCLQTRQEASGRGRAGRHHGDDDDFYDDYGSATATPKRHPAGRQPHERIQQGQHPEGDNVERIFRLDADQVQWRHCCGASQAAGPSVRDAAFDSRPC